MSEIIASAIVEASTLESFLDRQLALVDESKWHFTDGGIEVRAVDPANVAMARVEIEDAAFESYDSPGEAVVGMPLERVEEKLNVANAGDLVQIELDMETRTLNVDIRHINQTVALIDQESIRQEPDLPDIEEHMSTEATFTGAALDEAVTAIGNITDHILFSSSVEDEHIQLIGEGDTDNTVATFDAETDGLIYADVGADAETLLSLNYVEDLIKPIDSDAEVDIEHGDEFPIQLWHDAAEGHIHVHNYMAPRIRND